MTKQKLCKAYLIIYMKTKLSYIIHIPQFIFYIIYPGTEAFTSMRWGRDRVHLDKLPVYNRSNTHWQHIHTHIHTCGQFREANSPDLTLYLKMHQTTLPCPPWVHDSSVFFKNDSYC